MRVPFSITKHTISFYARGRQWSLASGQASFDQLRAALQIPQDQDHDIDQLIAHVDVKQGLINKSKGEIVFIDDQIVWRGQPLHNVWVEKILDFRDRGEPFDPIWNALNKLVHNPTPAAVERLPIFLERAGLGFLPDGRFIAFKGVAGNLQSLHQNLDGSYFTHEIGAKPRMERHQVDADPNRTCSHGLHVGAPNYVRNNYSGGTKQVVLVAVDPVDVVAVPTDYNGEKMRVCGYEVIDHLDKDYSDELLGKLRTTVTGYEPPAPAPQPEASPAERAKEGDIVTVSGDEDSDTPAGTYTVIEIDESDPNYRLCVATSSGQAWIANELVIDVQDGQVLPGDLDTDEEDEDEDEGASPFDDVNTGDVIEFTSMGATLFGRVQRIQLLEPVVLDYEGDEVTVCENEFTRVVPADDLQAAMVTYRGCTVAIAGHPALRDGTYTVSGSNDDEPDAQQDAGDDEFFLVYVVGKDGATIPVTNGNIDCVTSPDGETLFPRLDHRAVLHQTAGGYSMRSTDGSDLRQLDRPLRAQVGDHVDVAEGGWPPAGRYPVADVSPTGVIVQTLYDGLVFVNDDQITAVYLA